MANDSATSSRSSGSAGPRPPLWVVSDPAPQPYRETWDLQKRLWAQRWAGAIPDTLLFLEHTPVVTLGRNARRENLLLSEALFHQRGVELVEVDRGGDVTYHGPGQLIGYWIFDLRAHRQDVHWFLRTIEEALIRALARFGVDAGRDPSATGVWVEGMKVAAMGLHLSHWVSTHGFALNVTTDLTPFSWIVPCGLHGRGVTSMKRLGARSLDRAELEREIEAAAAALFARTPERVDPPTLRDVLLALERRGDPGPAGTPAASATGGRSVECPV
jgi:lipoyl(octanoyl) transferase